MEETKMAENEEKPIDNFLANVRKGAGPESRVLEITIDHKVANIMGLEAGDTVQVILKKITKEKTE